MTKIKDGIVSMFAILSAAVAVLLLLLVLEHIISQSYPAWTKIGIQNLFNLQGKWQPTSANPGYSLLPAICGTLYISLLAVLFTLIFGVGCSVFLVFYVPEKVSHVFFSFIGMLAGVPSVIFGFIGLSVLVKWFLNHLNLPSGQCVLAGSIVLGVMLLPFVIFSCSESMVLAQKRYELSMLSLGISREAFIVSIVLPSIGKSVVASAVMAFGRGLGETMAVMMVIGNSAIYPKLLGRGQTIPVMTALEMGSVGYGSLHLSALYAANLVLLLILFLVIGLGELLKWRIRKDEAYR